MQRPWTEGPKSHLNTAETPPWADEESHETLTEVNDSDIEDELIPDDHDSLTRPLGQNKSVGSEVGIGPTWGQQVASVLSHLLAIAAIAIVSTLITLPNMGGGGLSWEEGQASKVFNWHPLMMIVAFVLMTLASLAFRTPCTCVDRVKRKLYHGMMWTLSIVCVIVGLVAVFKSHNDPINGYIANMYSLHSWVGCIVLCLYALQFVGGFTFFGLKIGTASFKAKLLKVHQFYGSFIYYGTAATILLGIQEKEGFIGCSYTVTEPDLKPYEHYDQIPYVCRISHMLGLVVFLMALSTGYSIYNFPIDRDN